jgi:hypothetical protein
MSFWESRVHLCYKNNGFVVRPGHLKAIMNPGRIPDGEPRRGLSERLLNVTGGRPSYPAARAMDSIGQEDQPAIGGVLVVTASSAS